MNRFERAAYDTWKTASPPEDKVDVGLQLLDKLFAEIIWLRMRLAHIADAIKAPQTEDNDRYIKEFVDEWESDDK